MRKTRELFLVGQTRIHLDDVEGLGMFAELEMVIQAGQSIEDATSISMLLMRKLNIDEADLVECAYLDLLEKREEKNRPLKKRFNKTPKKYFMRRLIQTHP